MTGACRFLIDFYLTSTIRYVAAAASKTANTKQLAGGGEACRQLYAQLGAYLVGVEFFKGFAEQLLRRP